MIGPIITDNEKVLLMSKKPADYKIGYLSKNILENVTCINPHITSKTKCMHYVNPTHLDFYDSMPNERLPYTVSATQSMKRINILPTRNLYFNR